MPEHPDKDKDSQSKNPITRLRTALQRPPGKPNPAVARGVAGRQPAIDRGKAIRNKAKARGDKARAPAIARGEAIRKEARKKKRK